MTLKRMLVVDVELHGSYCHRSYAFPVRFSKRKTNREELRSLVAVQLREELGQDLYRDIQEVVVYLSSDIGCVRLCSFKSKNQKAVAA